MAQLIGRRISVIFTKSQTTEGIALEAFKILNNQTPDYI